MNSPIGLVTASTAPRKIAIWNQPFAVMARTSPDSAAHSLDTPAATRTPLITRLSQFPWHTSVQALAGVHIGQREHKENDGQNDENEIPHSFPPTSSRASVPPTRPGPRSRCSAPSSGRQLDP